MFNKITFMSILMLFLGNLNLSAQNPLQIETAYINLDIDTSHTHNLPAEANAISMANIPFCVDVVAVFSDTALVDTVYIKVGRTLGGDEVANVSFPYTGSNLPTSLSEFTKNGTGLSVCVAPSAQNAVTLYLEIWADDINGNTTPVYSMRVN